MGRVYNPNRPGKERTKLLKVMKISIAELQNNPVDSEDYKDLSAFILLTAQAISRTIDTTTSAWEKRGYWLKADRFRNDWSWIESCSKSLDTKIHEVDWDSIINITESIQGNLREINVSKNHRYGQPWQGAYKKLIGT